jgi:hypothetical protein
VAEGLTRHVRVALLVALIGCACSVEVQAQRTRATPTAFVTAFRTTGQKGELNGHPYGVSGGWTLSHGAGIGARWATGDDIDYWSVGFLQMSPAIKGAKSVQPFGTAGVCRVIQPDRRDTCLEAGGGVLLFFSPGLGVGVDLRYLRGFHGGLFKCEELCEKHVSLALGWRF